MKFTRLLLVGAAIFLCTGISTADSTEKVSVRYKKELIHSSTSFDFRAEIAEPEEIESLSGDPEKLHTSIESRDKENERRLLTTTDFHAVFPVSFRELRTLLSEVEDEDDIYSRITHTHDLTPEKGQLKPHLQEVKTAFRFFGIGVEQHYILTKKAEQISDKEFIVKWNLAESLDGKFYQYYGSWYIKKLPSHSGTNRPRTYIRNFTSLGFINPPRGTKLVYRLFLDNEIEKFFHELYDETVE